MLSFAFICSIGSHDVTLDSEVLSTLLGKLTEIASPEVITGAI